MKLQGKNGTSVSAQVKGVGTDAHIFEEAPKPRLENTQTPPVSGHTPGTCWADLPRVAGNLVSRPATTCVLSDPGPGQPPPAGRAPWLAEARAPIPRPSPVPAGRRGSGSWREHGLRTLELPGWGDALSGKAAPLVSSEIGLSADAPLQGGEGTPPHPPNHQFWSLKFQVSFQEVEGPSGWGNPGRASLTADYRLSEARDLERWSPSDLSPGNRIVLPCCVTLVK